MATAFRTMFPVRVFLSATQLKPFGIFSIWQDVPTPTVPALLLKMQASPGKRGETVPTVMRYMW